MNKFQWNLNPNSYIFKQEKCRPFCLGLNVLKGITGLGHADGAHHKIPNSKVHGVIMGPTWVLSSPGGPHVGPMNLAIWDTLQPHPYEANAR